MNKVYLSGRIFDEPKLLNRPEIAPHAVFHLLVKHRSKAGIQGELYRISAWHACAEHCAANLARGMTIMLEGYLTQRPISVESRIFRAVEVTANEILLPSQSFHAQGQVNEAAGTDVAEPESEQQEPSAELLVADLLNQ